MGQGKSEMMTYERLLMVLVKAQERIKELEKENKELKAVFNPGMIKAIIDINNQIRRNCGN
jgi:hypothetical protein